MAGAERLKERIIEDAKHKADINISVAEQKAKDIILEAERKASEKRGQMIERAKKEAEAKRERMIAASKLEGKKRVLETKQQLINDVFDAVLHKMRTMPVDKYRDVLEKMILNSPLEKENEIIFSKEDYDRIDHGFADRINGILSERGIKSRVSISQETRPLKGGFILRMGNIEINNSFDSIIRMRRHELEKYIVEGLFSI